MVKSFLLSQFLLLSFVSVASASSSAFYGKPAGWLFDLIKAPTTVRRFYSIDNGQKVGVTQITLNHEFECTVHGKTIDFPKFSSEGQLALCTVKSDRLDTIIPSSKPWGGASVSFEGKTAQSLYGILTNIDYSAHDSLYKSLYTRKVFGGIATEGMMCTEVVPDDHSVAATYSCAIFWK